MDSYTSVVVASDFDAQTRQAWRALGARLASARIDKGWKQDYVAGKVGVKQGSISRVEAGKAPPSDELLAELAELYELDMEELRFLLAPAMADRIPEEYRHFVRIERNPEAPNTAPMRSGKREEGRFPVYGMAACGSMAEALKNDRLPHGEKRTTDPWLEAVRVAKSKNAFAVEAEGESMLPTIQPGDELLVDPRAKLENGCIALVQLGGSATIKRWKLVSGVVILTPDNPDRKRFPERAISTQEFQAEGGIAWRCVLARTSRPLERKL